MNQEIFFEEYFYREREGLRKNRSWVTRSEWNCFRKLENYEKWNVSFIFRNSDVCGMFSLDCNRKIEEGRGAGGKKFQWKSFFQ